ncbi:F-box only protein 39-like [Gigantopelta aegis]|uniref:F-box only protein 39-like n=1 Tax=Gigantopelta aegis TaxID=1735272 RepID=UPI001B88A6B2|nr:F-box only protein 39-like [Gigantopelta aegis]
MDVETGEGLDDQMNYRMVDQTGTRLDEKMDDQIDDRTDDRMDDHMWSNLPDTALIEIYLCLQDPERVNMSMTCKNWNRIFSSPCLWRTWYIELGGYNYISTGERICKFADGHGDHPKYLFLSYDHRRHHTCKIIQRTIDDFLDKIQNAKLVNFEFQNASFMFETLKENVVDSFARFFRGQTNMVDFNMERSHLSLTSGCRILHAIGSASGNTIRNLDIEDFFDSMLAMFQVKQFINALSKFTNLSFLALNYNCLSDDILECLTQNLAGKLKHISCRVCRTDPHFHRISSYSWKSLKSVCPKLSIDFWFESIGLSADIIRVLVPEAPLHEIYIDTRFDHNADWLQLSETIDHIAKHHKQITVLSVKLHNNHDSIDDSLVSMVTQCPALRVLFVRSVLKVSTIDEICTLQTEHKIDLQTFHVTTCGLTEMEYAELIYVSAKHLSVMQERGLNFEIRAVLGRQHL